MRNRDERVVPVYIGAAEYAAGPPVALETEVRDIAMRRRLRSADHGARTFARWDGDDLELVEAALRNCLRSSQRDAREIDAVFLLSNGLDAKNNLDAGWLGDLSQRLGLSSVPHYQIGMAGCAGFHWAARLATGLIRGGECLHVLVATFDKADGVLQRLYGEATDSPYLTGDAAAACVFSSSPRAMSYRLVGRVVNVWDGGQVRQSSLHEEVRCVDRLFRETCAGADLSLSEIDLFITNNYSLDVSRLYCQVANISFSKAFTQTIATHAHCFGSDNIINLRHAHLDCLIAPEQHSMLFSAGPYQWGACVIEGLGRPRGLECQT